MDKLIRPVLGEQEMAAIVDRLSGLYEAAERERIRKVSERELVFPAPINFNDWPIPSRMDCVDDRQSGLEYCAWCIGETLAACGGGDLLHLVFDLFERRNTARASSWLDHRWNGVSVEGKSHLVRMTKANRDAA